MNEIDNNKTIDIGERRERERKKGSQLIDTSTHNNNTFVTFVLLKYKKQE